jgi:hypothetical protein
MPIAVEWSGNGRHTVFVRVLEQRREESEPAAERERVNLTFDRAARLITATYASGRQSRTFELDLNAAGQVVLNHAGRELTAEKASELILGPALFPELEEGGPSPAGST